MNIVTISTGRNRYNTVMVGTTSQGEKELWKFTGCVLTSMAHACKIVPILTFRFYLLFSLLTSQAKLTVMGETS